MNRSLKVAIDVKLFVAGDLSAHRNRLSNYGRTFCWLHKRAAPSPKSWYLPELYAHSHHEANSCALLPHHSNQREKPRHTLWRPIIWHVQLTSKEDICRVSCHCRFQEGLSCLQFSVVSLCLLLSLPLHALLPRRPPPMTSHRPCSPVPLAPGRSKPATTSFTSSSIPTPIS